MLNDYRAIMLANGDDARQIWVTEFGWGTSEDAGAPPENSSFIGDNTLAEQASYLTRAFELGANTGFVGVMIVVRPASDAFNAFSLLALTGVAFSVLRDLSTRRIGLHVPAILLVTISAFSVTTAASGIHGA